MFKFVLAFLIWLFATGKYTDWLALVTGQSTAGSENSGAASTSTPDDLLASYSKTLANILPGS